MELDIKSIGKVESAKINLNSISVIAGYNGSGKTTISKCLYGMLELMQSRELDSNIAIDYWSRLFSNQMTTIGRDERDEIKLIDGDCFLSFSRICDEFRITRSEEHGSRKAIYLRSPSRWSDPFSDQLREELSKPMLKDSSRALLEYKRILDKNASGYLKRVGDGYAYVDEDFPDAEISIYNTASGVMLFLELSRLIGNGTITPESVLIIDEPETNLHPEKQVSLARVLVEIAKEMGIKLFLSSHNIYFIRALEVALNENGIDDYKFYAMRKDKNSKLYNAIDVSDNTEEIYQELYRPMEEL